MDQADMRTGMSLDACGAGILHGEDYVAGLPECGGQGGGAGIHHGGAVWRKKPLIWEDARWLVHLAFIMKKFIQKIVIAY